MNFAQIAERLNQLLETIKLDNGKSRVCFTDASVLNRTEDHEALSDAIYRLNDIARDYAYEWTRNYLQHVAETVDLDDLEEVAQTWSSESVDVYTSDLTEWLAASNYHIGYIDEVLQEWEPKTGSDLLTGAQEKARYDVAQAINEVLEKLAKEDDEPTPPLPCADCAGIGEHVNPSCTE